MSWKGKIKSMIWHKWRVLQEIIRKYETSKRASHKQVWGNQSERPAFEK